MTEDPASMTPEPTGDAALAADVALGALSGPELRAAELRMARDPAFASLVAEWREILVPLLDSVAAVAPPPAVWERIDAATQPASRHSGAVVTATPRSIWSSLALWRALAGGASAVAALSLGVLILRPGPAAMLPPLPAAPAQPLLAATLSSPDGEPLLTATWDPARGAVILTPAAKASDETRTPELWVIEGDNPPRSLGTIDLRAPEAHVIPADRLRGLRAGSTLAISLEPPGGSPTGAPTGPVVATGKLNRI